MAAHRLASSKQVTAVASLLAAATLLFSPAAVAALSGNSGDAWQGTTQSWALGVVLPNGANLANGALLSWTEARNITVLVRLPNITDPEGVTYIVLSAEGDDGGVFQVAAGIWPGCDTWSVYSWYVTGMGSSSLSYRWVANSSGPSMSPGDLVAMSISLNIGEWRLSVNDFTTTASSTVSATSPTLTKFVRGDQEVLALESYTESVSTFRMMGNASMQGLWVDGSKVIGGWYSHGGWDPAHSPLFEVGTTAPPTFVTLSLRNSGEAVWNYDAQWTGTVSSPTLQPILLAYAALAALVPVAFVLGRRLGRKGMEVEG